MNQQSEHLSDAQIEQYGKSDSGAGPETEAWVETHLDDCPLCRGRVLDLQRTRFALLPDPKVKTVPTSDCPSEDDLRNLAAGLCSEPIAQKLKAHAATCNHCGPLLREYIEDFSDNFTPEEQAILDQLSSASPKWQRQTARKMLKPVRDNHGTRVVKTGGRLFSWKWLMVPALPAVALIAVGIWYLQRDTPEKVEKYMAQAYTEQRTMDMRWPGAEWGPVRITRGPEDTRFSKPRTLLKAEDIIAQKQPAAPTDVEWLRARAQADILDRNPEPAIASLSQAFESHPGSIPLMLDLSIAYSLQGEISGDPKNYEKAVDFLGEVLKKEPGNLTALFNRALLDEQMQLVDNAISDWQAFLQKEKDPRWAEDAKKRLSALEELKRKKSSVVAPATIEEWASALASNRGPTVAEEALDTAVIEWLPNAFSGSANINKKAASARLLATVAKSLQAQHGDNWLGDLLSFSSSSHFTRAAAELSNAVRLNSQGKASDAIAPAKQAQFYFRRDHNVAGLARAQLEEVYAYQRSGAGSACLQRASDLKTNIHGRKYPWLNYQLLLDKASCFNILGRLEEAKLDADDVLAQDDGSAAFKVLRLRALGIAAALATTRGDSAFAVQHDLDGLKEYWAGEYPIIRAYQFYSDLSFNAEAAELWHLTYAADKEAVWAIAQTPNKQVEAIARYRLAKAAVMVGQEQIERDEAREADRILTGLPQNESTLIARTDGVIGVIRAYLNLGETDAASKRLKQLNLSPAALESRLVSRRLQQVRGDIEFKLGHFKEAQDAYLAAVSIAESSLSTLRDDRDRLQWSQENGPSYRALANTLIRQDDSVAALEVWELYRAAPVRGTNAIAEPVAQQNKEAHLTLAGFNNSGIVHKIQPRLRNETLIIYAFLPDGLGIWSLDDSGIDFQFAQLSARETQRLARQFTEECSNPRSDLAALRKDGADLYNALLSASSPRLKSGRLLSFEIDGELDNLPFAALVDKSGKYLVETYPMMFSPGLAYRDYLRKPEPIRRTDHALIVGNPTISPKWRRILPALPSARAEAEAVAAKFENPVVLIGPRASSYELERALSDTRVFQFAGHSIETNSGSVLVLAASEHQEDSDLFTISPPYYLRHLQLAVLSACSTGRGQVTSTGAIIRPFLMAGVPQVIGTSWKIDSEVAAEFIPKMYEELLSQKTAPEALRIAAIMVQQRQARNHPYYWAAFANVGRG